MDKNSDITAFYHEGGVTKRQMRGLAFFAEKFVDPDFVLGHFAEVAVTKNGPRKPEFILSDTAKEFVTYCIDEHVIEPSCLHRMEWNFGKLAIGRDFVAEATPYEIIELLTYLIGNHVHWQGRLIKAFQNGMLQQILDRSVAWAYPENVDGPLLWELTD